MSYKTDEVLTYGNVRRGTNLEKVPHPLDQLIGLGPGSRYPRAHTLKSFTNISQLTEV
jgi:hypothetical protein